MYLLAEGVFAEGPYCHHLRGERERKWGGGQEGERLGKRVMRRRGGG
jgi:hypothetical protein